MIFRPFCYDKVDRNPLIAWTDPKTRTIMCWKMRESARYLAEIMGTEGFFAWRGREASIGSRAVGLRRFCDGGNHHLTNGGCGMSSADFSNCSFFLSLMQWDARCKKKSTNTMPLSLTFFLWLGCCRLAESVKDESPVWHVTSRKLQIVECTVRTAQHAR